MSDDWPGVPATRSDPGVAGPGATGAPAARLPVVIVDGDRAEVGRIARVLRDAGHPVIAATDGRAALRLVFASSVGPGLLVSAIELTEMSGIELAARLTAARPGVRVILMSADPQVAERARAHVAQVQVVLLKPFTDEELRAAACVALAADAAVEPAADPAADG